MWPISTRRRDIVIREGLARDAAKWLISSEETVSGALNDVERERFFRLVERALDSESDHELWHRLSKYVMAVFPDKESWTVVKKRFYAARRKLAKDSKSGRTIQVSDSIYEELLTLKESKGVTFSEVIDMLLESREDGSNRRS